LSIWPETQKQYLQGEGVKRKYAIDPLVNMKQCKAKSKRTGEQCKNYAVKGMNVCHMHGGKLGGKKAREARRLAALKHGFYTKEAIDERKNIVRFIKNKSKENFLV